MNTPTRPRRASWLAAALLGTLAACSSPSDPADRAIIPSRPVADGDGPPAPLGAYSRQTSTEIPAAQAWFDRGLLWTYGFNHAEAVRCFQRAQELDPGFAMAHWGEALALGPNINAPMEDPAVAAQAYAASRKALDLSADALPVERTLIVALQSRYADHRARPMSAEFRKDLDAAYATAMAEAWHAHPSDPEVGTLYADALMNQRPWDYWTSKFWEADGQPKEGMQQALDTLRKVVADHPRHPGAHHMRIHLCEASPFVAEAVESADALAGLVPGSGHLVHMPSHAWIRVGRYRDAERVNLEAVQLDRNYFAKAGPQGLYEFYQAHNSHFLAWAAMYGGRYQAARDAARALVADLPQVVLVDYAVFADGFLPVELHVLVRFGKWAEILAFDEFHARYPFSRAMRAYARGIAFAATGETAAARVEQERFEELADLVPADAMIFYNRAHDVLAIGRAMLAGEISYREGDHDRAWSSLRSAAAAEDALSYDEPSPWMMPVRHALGALSLEQDLVEQAEQAYREDLVRHPENGWALHGLAECARKRGDEAAAKALTARFDAAWQHADTPLSNGSCFCRGLVGAEMGSCCEGSAKVATGD